MTLSYDLSEDVLLKLIKDYAYNGMELCRLVNGIDPFDFKGCNYSKKEKDWFDAKGGCKHKQRGCKYRYTMIYYRLRKMQKKGLVKSLKMKWIDGRDPGAVDYIPTDMFRFWYIEAGLLSTRLCQDVITKLGNPDYL